MAGPNSNSKISVLLIALGSLCLPAGMAYPAEEIFAGDTEPLAYQLSEANKFQQEEVAQFNQNDRPRSCFHFYVSRNMSSLLSDATKMLQQVRDRREREWILTFIYRIKSLAEHLRTHPDSRNYDCLSTEDETRRRNSKVSDPLKSPQQELYFVDDMWPNPVQKRANSAPVNSDTESNHQESQSSEAESQKSSDNQSPHPFSTGAWREESMSSVSTEKKSENSNPVSEQSSSAVESTSKEHDAPGKLVDSIPVVADATHQELNKQDNGESKDGNGSPPMVEDKVTNGETDDNSSPVEKKPYDNVIVISSPPDCKSNMECEEALNRHIAASGQTGESSNSAADDDVLVQQLHSRQHQKNMEEDRIQHRILKERIRKALLEEMAPEVKKLRTVGGSENDLINLWKQSESEIGKSTEIYHDGDFDYEEIGAAAGDLSSNDPYTTNDHTVAPSLGEMQNFKRQLNSGSGTKAYKPYDDSDVLVKQLFDVRFEQAPSKTTKSLSDQREEYLITSTHVPY